MFKRCSLLMAVLASIGLVAAPSADAAKPTGRPFKGSATGFALYGYGPAGAGSGTYGLANVLDCNIELGPEFDFFKVTTFASADGIASHLGAVHLEFAHCPTPTGPTQGHLGIVAANGDVLYGEYTGTYDPNLITIEFKSTSSSGSCPLLNDVPCTSTGRFADVVGTAFMSADAYPGDENDLFAPWPWSGSWKGRLNY